MRQTTLSNGYPISNEYGSFPRSNVRPSFSSRSMISRDRNARVIPGVTTSSPYPSSNASFHPPQGKTSLSTLYEPYIHVPKQVTPIIPPSNDYNDYSGNEQKQAKEASYEANQYYREHYEDEETTKKSTTSSLGEKTLITQLPKYNKNNSLIPEKISPNTLPCLVVHNHIIDCPICMKLYLNKWYVSWWPWIGGGIMILIILWLWHRRCVHRALIHHLQEINKQIQHQLSLMKNNRQYSSNHNISHSHHHNSHNSHHASITTKK
uniref:Uncharacterized protein n=1 Tax=viral metagenome TaxID=1070528 RepID=A0A6C0D130_9ZZZZ